MIYKKISKEESEQFSKRRWIHLINSLSGYKSANLVGTCDQDGSSNLAIVSSTFHLGARPPLMGFVLRPHTSKSPRHTLMNIKQTGYFTLNHVHQGIYRQSHQTSARYQRSESEFEKVGLSEAWKDFPAPFVEESRVQVGLKLKEIIDVTHNSTHIIIAEIQKFYIAEKAIMDDGYVDLEALETVAVSGLDSYHAANRLARLSYAKPNQDVETIPVSGIKRNYPYKMGF